ncbi:LON peptidase substrate-binding domain-containing protein [Sungkyunkwania multivorans]|uniref:LON peptidase substrate-binding domain-containing protein n=1 Tax=Sungkyunkwania multivorans TaxID=1173618 RepID=A0ABW3CU28_9FLAO
MSYLLPMFPLQVVVFPGERVPLHIFEERYQELIRDCETEAITFGIPPYINNKMQFGTEISLERVVKKYPNGASDVVCVGSRIFKIEKFYENFPGKLYAGAEVTFPERIDDSVTSIKMKAFEMIQKLFKLIGAKSTTYEDSFNSFTFAHTLGLSIENEYELLKFTYESERLKFIIDHLGTTIPIIKEMHRTQELIMKNGHFRNYDPLDFKEFKIE